MAIEIRRLTPDLLEDYLYFFEHVAHEDNEDEDRCYCIRWCSADHREGLVYCSPEARREYAIQYINSGHLQGYLAYDGDEVAGWCNANTKAASIHCCNWLMFMTGVETGEGDARVKSVFCFTVAPAMRRRGIARQLLERVCEDAAQEDFDFVEGYPNREFTDVFQDYMGPRELYEKLGFTPWGETEHTLVVRKRVR